MPPWPYPLWIAHRGAGKLAPENTLAAFRLGASHGWRAFECDVKLSRDGLPFLLHDDTLQRTTSWHGVAGELDWTALSTLDAGSWHSPAFAGEPPASLAAVAGFCQAGGCALNIEIKPTMGHELLTGQVVAREAARLWQGAATQPLLSSFMPQALQGAMQAAPQLPRALLLDSLSPDWLAQAQGFECVAVVSAYRLMDKAMIDAIHAAGMRALVYTVNDPSVAQRLIDDGIDGIITDAVNRFNPAG